jgi:hypothetical protein
MGLCRKTPFNGHRVALGIALLCLAGVSAGQAVLFYALGDPEHNTTPPTGALQDSGWQWLGTWGTFLGTPVHPKFFLTADHVGGRIGDPFRFRGQTFITRSSVRVPNSDLRLWEICGVFDDFAPLHTNRNLAGRTLVWFGRGTERGAAVTLTNQETTELRGWRWGPDTRRTRWGENRVEESVESEKVGHLLRATFDADGGPNECHLSVGDSGGPAFVLEDGRWELAGIHYAVDGPYSYTAAGPGFRASLFNHQGFYWQENSEWVPTTDLEAAEPGSFFTTEVAAYAGWILDSLAGPIPPDDAPFLQRAGAVHGPFADVPEAVIDWDNRTISLELPLEPVFFRLRGCQPLRMTGARIEHELLVFDYE